MRGAEHTMLPSATVQTEHPSVKSIQDGLSLTNSIMFAGFSDALSSAVSARAGKTDPGNPNKTTKMKTLTGNPSTSNFASIYNRSFEERIATFIAPRH